MADDGIWISYCAKGYVKRNLRKAGFEVKALPGPPRKREITLAIKKGLNK
ncbi:MnmC family methyltransferase [Membranihabitans marinus]